MRYYLLTGSTGLLGQYLLREALLSRLPVAVLVRPLPNANCRQRIEAVLQRVEEELGRALPRPVVIEGDLNQPGLGLAHQDRQWLAENCNAVIHSAASITFYTDQRSGEPYRSNVTGMRHLLQLCRESAIGEFHYVSTAYVCGQRSGRILEHELDVGQTLGNDYERSKFEAETLLRDEAFPTPPTIYRPSIIVGDSKTGYTSAFHGVYAALRIFWQLSQQDAAWASPRVPFSDQLGLRGNERKNLVPVDWAAAAIMHIVGHARHHGQTYHVAHPTPVSVQTIGQAFGDAVVACMPPSAPGQRKTEPTALAAVDGSMETDPTAPPAVDGPMKTEPPALAAVDGTLKTKPPALAAVDATTKTEPTTPAAVDGSMKTEPTVPPAGAGSTKTEPTALAAVDGTLKTDPLAAVDGTLKTKPPALAAVDATTKTEPTTPATVGGSMKTEPTTPAAGPDDAIDQPVRPEASAYRSGSTGGWNEAPERGEPQSHSDRRTGFRSGPTHSAAQNKDALRQSLGVYDAYFRDDPEFDTANLQRAVSHLPCPPLEYEQLKWLAECAIQSNFGWPRKPPPEPAFCVECALEPLLHRKGPIPLPTDRLDLELSGPGGGAWSIAFSAGRPVGAERGVGAEQGVGVYATVATFLAILRGEIDVQQAIADGRVVATGVPSDLTCVQDLLDRLHESFRTRVKKRDDSQTLTRIP